jgi:hypothetical protein
VAEAVSRKHKHDEVLAELTPTSQSGSCGLHLKARTRIADNISTSNITSATILRTTMGVKRPHAAMDAQDSTANQSPFMPMFEGFRAELDEHHDRRERIIKASRDITASSKKM